jgi:hypothetical protein
MSWHACLVKPMSWHAFWQCLGMLSRVFSCLVKPKSWHALSCPCRDMPFRANVEACRAHVVACMPCQAHGVACLVALSWHVKPCGCMPCHAHVVTCLVEPMSRHVEPMLWHACLVEPMSWHALCQCLGMSTRVVACLVMFPAIAR